MFECSSTHQIGDGWQKKDEERALWQEFCSCGHRFRTRLANGEKPTSEWHGSSAIAASRWPSLGFFGSPYAIRELYNTCWWHVIYLRNVWKIVCVCIIECLVNYGPWLVLAFCKRILVMGNLKDQSHRITLFGPWPYSLGPLDSSRFVAFFSPKKIEQ